jgi:hypothetical protein
MKYDINTVSDLIDSLDGPEGAAARFKELSPQAICNWRMRGAIPPSRHMQVAVLMKRMGKTIRPDVLGMDRDDWELLFPSASSSRRRRSCSRPSA